jgi:predicted RNA-binding Zn ribbon-like protein
MSERSNPLAGLSLVGGRLCLDFANTVAWRGEETVDDRLTGYPALAWWGERAGVVDAAATDALLRAAEREPGAAEGVFRRAVALREATHRLFAAAARGAEPAAADLELLNAELARGLAHVRLERAAPGYAWGWEEGAALDRVLWPVARSAAELLTSPELARVGTCASESCGWLYLDTSKNHSRRWCDMRDCGNRAKVRRHYRRAREGQAE